MGFVVDIAQVHEAGTVHSLPLAWPATHCGVWPAGQATRQPLHAAAGATMHCFARMVCSRPPAQGRSSAFRQKKRIARGMVNPPFARHILQKMSDVLIPP